VKPKFRTVKAHSAPVRCVEFSPDDHFVLSSSDDKSAKVWRVNDLKFQYSLYGHRNWVNTGRFSPDMRMIATGSEDQTVKIWDAEIKKLTSTF
jgi:centriolar protein POC1